MQVEQEPVTQLFCGSGRGQRVGIIVGQISADRLDEEAQADPVVAMIPEQLQAGHGVGAVFENDSLVLSLFQKRQVRAESKLRRARGGGKRRIAATPAAIALTVKFFSGFRGVIFSSGRLHAIRREVKRKRAATISAGSFRPKLRVCLAGNGAGFPGSGFLWTLQGTLIISSATLLYAIVYAQAGYPFRHVPGGRV